MKKADDPHFLDNAEFREIAELDEGLQRELLHAENPRVRVWAAWALGLRLSDAFAPEARDSIANERVAGVRRHLLVMLAGFGEVDIVAALARHDADPYVRKTAARFVGELAVNHPDAFAIAAQLLDDDDDDIRAALIDGLPDELPESIAQTLRDAHADASDIVREALARRDASALDLDSLRETATSDPNSGIRRTALEALLGEVGAVRTLEPLSHAERVRAVADLEALGVELTFEDIAPLRPGPGFLRVLKISELGSAGRAWLLGLVDHPIRDYWRVVGQAYAEVVEVDTAEERAAIRTFVDRVEDSLRLDGEFDAAETGALTEWGNWSPWETQRRTVLELVREHID